MKGQNRVVLSILQLSLWIQNIVRIEIYLDETNVITLGMMVVLESRAFIGYCTHCAPKEIILLVFWAFPSGTRES